MTSVCYHVFRPNANQGQAERITNRMRFQNVLATNRPSPLNEDDWIRAYKKAVPSAENEDNYDIAAVVTIGGCVGHAMMKQSDNRSHDDDCHMCYNFVSDDELKRYM